MSARLCATRRERRDMLRNTATEQAPTEPVDTYGTAADIRRKRLDDLKAGFAFRGYALDELTGGELLAHRWGLSRRLATLDDAAAFLRAIGGAE